MGGKAKQAQRTKNNVRPSSSGRSAELLSSTAAGPRDVGGGISLFPSLAAAAPAPGLNTDLTLIVKKLNKKDPITKTKALQELNDLLKSSDVDDIAPLLPNWAHFYKVLSVDMDRKVRELTQLCHGSVVLTCGRRIAPHLRVMLPMWLRAAHDDHAPASARAMIALTSTFPGDKLSEAIAFCGDEVMTYLIDNVLNKNLNVGKKTDEDTSIALEQYARLASSSLSSLQFVVVSVSDKHQLWLKDAITPLTQANVFWKLPSNAAVAVRTSWCGLVGCIAQRFGSHFVSEFGSRALRACLNLRDNITNVHWTAILQLLHADKEAISREKLGDILSSRVISTIQDGGWGSATELTDTLHMILDVLDTDDNIQIVQFYEKLFEAFVCGFKMRRVNSAKAEMAVWLRGFAQCIDRASKSEASRPSSIHALRQWVLEATIPNAPVSIHARVLASLAVCWCRHQLLDRVYWQTMSGSVCVGGESQLDVTRVLAHVALLMEIRKALSKDPKKSSSVRFGDITLSDVLDNASESPESSETPTSLDKDVSEHKDVLLSELLRAEERTVAAYIDAIWTEYKEAMQRDGNVVCGVINALLPLVNDFDAERFSRTSLCVCGPDSTALTLFTAVLLPWLRNDVTCSAAVFRLAVMLAHADGMSEQHAQVILNALDECDLHVWEWAVEYCTEMPVTLVTSQRAVHAVYAMAARAHTDVHALNNLIRAINTPGAISASTASSIAGSAANALDADGNDDVSRANAANAAATLAKCLANNPPNSYALLITSLCRYLLTYNDKDPDVHEVVPLCIEAVRCGINAMDTHTRRVGLADLARCIRANTTSISRVSTLFPILLSPECSSDVAELAETISLLLPKDSAARADIASALTRLSALSGNASTPLQPPDNVYKDDVPLDKDVVFSFMREVELLGSFTRSIVPSQLIMMTSSQSSTTLTDLVLRLLHNAAMLRTLTRQYGFWEHYSELSACDKRVDDAVRELSANIGRNIWPTLASHGARTGGSWAAATVYLATLVDNLETMSQQYLDDMSADGFFDSLQERAALEPDSEAVVEAVCLSARRAVVAVTDTSGGGHHIPLLPPRGGDHLDLIAELQFVMDAHYTNKFLIADTDISKCEWVKIEATMRVIRLCSLCVTRVGWDLPSPLWDFVSVFLSSLLSALNKSSKWWGSCAVACIAVPTLGLYQTVDSFISSIPDQCTRRQPSEHVAALPREWEDVFAPDNNANLYDFILHVLESCASSAMALSPARAHTISALTTCCPTLRWSTTKMEWRRQCAGGSSDGSRRVVSTALSVITTYHHPPAIGLAYRLILYMCPALVHRDVDELSSESAAESESAMTLLQPKLIRMLDLMEDHIHQLDYKHHTHHDDDNDDDELDQESRRIAVSLLLLVEVVGEVMLLASEVRPGLALRYGEELRGGDDAVPRGHDAVPRVITLCMRLLPNDVITWLHSRRPANAAPKQHAHKYLTQPNGVYTAFVTNDDVERLSCRALYVCVRGGGVRAADAALRRVTTAYISPYIIRQALMQAVKLQLTDIEVHVRGDELEVCAAVDEQSVRVCLKLAADHPLTPPTVITDNDVSSGRGAAQPDSRWLGLYLAGRGCVGVGGVCEAVRVWVGAVRARVDSAPCCYICYSRLANARLPAAHCRQCKNAFHTTCLRKWFASSNKSSCPLCRTDF